MPCLDCSGVYSGQVAWSGSRDSDGHREYRITHLVVGDDTPGFADGPANILNTPGLPIPGSLWVIDGDFDILARCKYDATVTPVIDKERNKHWLVEQIFTTKPDDKCYIRSGTGTGTGNPTDPLAEPPVISGGFVKYTQEATRDRFGFPITNSAFERIRGPLVEFDRSRLTVRIQMNESALDLNIKSAVIDTVNSSTLWGFAARTVKLSNITWEQKFYGSDCQCYFSTTYEFEIDPEGFDREALDEATKVLNGRWNKTTGTWELINIGVFGLGIPPDPTNPHHFIRLTDINGNPMRGVLNGAGVPATDDDTPGTTDPGSITIEYYPESDFLGELAIPSDIECAA